MLKYSNKINFFFFLILVFFFVSCTTTGFTGSESGAAAQRELETEKSEITTEDDIESNEIKAITPITDKSIKTPASASEEKLNSIEPLEFNEVWGYLISGEEASYEDWYPVTDIGYFGAGLNTFGELVSVPDRKKITKTNAKVHLVIADNGKALTHFCLDPQYSVRQKLIKQIVEATKPFDGLQIDFELVSAVDSEYFYSFLQELKKGIGKNKVFSVAIPARTKTLKTDAYNYEKISAIADKIIVMAYDEHWSTSAPGPVASMEWCKKVADYSASVIPPSKLVMGLPFYGRAWGDYDTAGAYRFTSVERLFRGEYAKGKLPEGTKVSAVTYEKGIPTFKVERKVTYTFYFDNTESLTNRLGMYKTGNINRIAFWRIGQEDVDIWQKLKITDAK